MKNSALTIGLILSAALSTSAGADGQPASQTAASTQATRHLVERFVDAYAHQDAVALAPIITRDFTARFDGTRSFNRVAVRRTTLIASWQQGHAAPSTYTGSALVAVYPTGQTGAVFVTYRVPGQTGNDRIALLELRGNQVARIDDFVTGAPAANLSIAAN
jgi:hypothetical protein